MKNKESLSIKKDFKTTLYFFKLCHKISKTYIPILFASSLLKALTPFVNIIFPKFIIDELLGQKRIEVFIALVAIIIISNFVLNMLNSWLDTLVLVKNFQINNGFDELIGDKIMDMDFEKIEDPEVLDLKEKSIFGIRNQAVLNRLIGDVVSTISEIITMLGLIAIISTLNIIIIAFIIGIVLLNGFIFKRSQKMQYTIFEKLTPINRSYAYFADTTSDFSLGKDIRLYNISPLLMSKLNDFNRQSIGFFNSLSKTMGRCAGINQINIQLQMLGIYAYMTYQVFKNYIGIGSFTMYITAATSFSASISEFINSFLDFRQCCRYLDLYLEFERIENKNSKEGKHIEPTDGYNVEFRKVSFKYPRSNSYTLKNISITITAGEKISVVGLNGAGKTTFIKLLTRLYEPTEGEILLNGVNINTYNYDEYMKLLSVVFQDFKLLAFTIKENIALEDHELANNNNIFEVLNKAGLEEAVSKLPKGIYTTIYKTFEKDGIEFSGGQAQKLAIARAIYKDAPIVVLDEPTAALDPISENEIYTRFNELIGDKTTIYISHRLSSCKFCDKIAVFHGGELIQYGTHDELIDQSGSQYEEMFMAQAQYYV